jgi:hypothetical protein
MQLMLLEQQNKKRLLGLNKEEAECIGREVEAWQSQI